MVRDTYTIEIKNLNKDQTVDLVEQITLLLEKKYVASKFVYRKVSDSYGIGKAEASIIEVKMIKNAVGS
jgi:hypothetical protein